jgi:hypothetical protein
MKGSIIDDTTAIGKRLNELTSKKLLLKLQHRRRADCRSAFVVTMPAG